MTIHITHTFRGASHHLKIDGELSGDSIETLREALALFHGCLDLELSGLSRVDAGAIDLLIAAIDEGARIASVDPYLELLLKTRQRLR